MRPFRIVAVTQSDPFFTGRFFETFLPECRALGVETIEIVLLRNFNESRAALATRMWKLYGTLDLVLRAEVGDDGHHAAVRCRRLLLPWMA